MLKNPRHEKFCLEYAACGNATEAYLKAGYGGEKRTSNNAAAINLLRKPHIAARIKEITAELQREKIADVIECQEILTVIARDETAENADRIKAIQTLMKAQGAFVTQINFKSTPIVISGGEQLED